MNLFTDISHDFFLTSKLLGHVGQNIFVRFRCSSKDENDFRPMFENFLHDLFVVVNFPEWPAAEVLLTQLGRLFVVTFSNTKLDMSLRSSALDYLSQIATHLRRSALKSQSEEEQEKLKIIVEKVSFHVDVLHSVHIFIANSWR